MTPTLSMTGVIAVGGTLISLVYCTEQGRAHEAPLGWTYPWSCCSSQDCQQAGLGTRSGEIEEGPDGYLITATGEVVPYNDKRVKDSPDQDFHWCAHVQGVDANRTLCLFRPPRGF